MEKEKTETLANGLSNHYLFDLLAKRLNLKSFAGVYAADTVPKSALLSKKARSTLCIVNTAKLSEKGKHFLTLLIKANVIYIIDSLALDLSRQSPALHRRLEKTQKQIMKLIKKPIQDKQSIFCGVYCCYFCLYLSRTEFPKRQGLKKLKYKNIGKNDNRVIHNVKRIIELNK